MNDINLGSISGYLKFDSLQCIAASFKYFSLGDIPYHSLSGSLISTYHPYEFSFDISYSRKLSNVFSLGTAVRYVFSDLAHGGYQSPHYKHGTSLACDISFLYSKKIKIFSEESRFNFGLNISNIGSKISYDKNVSSNFIPTNMRLGGSFDYPIDKFNKISVSVDLNKLLVPTQNSMTAKEYSDLSPLTGIFKSFSDAPGGLKEELQEVMWSLGAEYAYNNQFFVRGGYFNESQYKGNRKYFTAGAGFKLNIFQLDAAYVISTAQTNPLDQTLRFSLSFDLFGLKNLIK